jgi:hypothetical protein
MQKLSKERYIAALKRIRNQILGGSKLEYEDSEVVGDKYITCSWGLCSNSQKQYPDKQDWFRPKPLFDGRISALDNPEFSHCPMDSEQESKETYGCFYRCRIFGAKKKDLPSREEAVRLYDITIAKHETGSHETK